MTRTPTSSRSGTARAGSRSAIAPAGPAFDGNVTSLQIIGQTLYVGGEFQNGAGIASADYLLACDLAGGASSTTVVDPAHPFSGSVYALAADSNGTLYAGGGFTNLREHRRRRQRRLPARRGHLAADGRGRGTVRLRGHRPSSAVSPPSGPTRTSARTRTTSRASRRPTTSRDGTGRRGAPWAPTAAARTGGSRRPPRSTPWSAPARTSSSPGRSRTRTATRAPTTSPSSTAAHGTRSGPTAPATARGTAPASRSRSSIASSTRQGASPAPAATPRRTPSPRSR